LNASNPADQTIINQNLIQDPPDNPPSIPPTVPNQDTTIQPSVTVTSDIGDTLGAAYPLNLPGNSKASIQSAIGDNPADPNDVDMFSVTATTGDVLTIDMSLLTTQFHHGFVRLFDASGHELANDATSGLEGSPRIANFKITANGTYYIGVSSFANTGYNPTQTGSGSGGLYTGNYLLSVERRIGTPTLRVQLVEAIDRFMAATQAAHAFQAAPLPDVLIRQAVTEFETKILSLVTTAPVRPAYLTFKDSTGKTTTILSDSTGSFAQALTPNSTYTLYAFDPTSLLGSVQTVQTGNSGSQQDLVPIVLGGASPSDTSDTGYAAVLQNIFGITAGNADPNGDGIPDLTEIQEGLNPFGKGLFPTGVISSLPLQGEASAVVVEGSAVNNQKATAYVATSTYGLAIVDASQFDNPAVLGQISLPGFSSDVAVDPGQNLAVVASGPAGVNLVNVSDPMAPTSVKTVFVPGGANYVQVFDSIAYVACGNTLVSVDLPSGDVLQTLNLGRTQITGLAREGTFIYTMDDQNTLRAVDISDLTMVADGSLTMPDGGGQLFVDNGFAYVAALSNPRGGYATAAVGLANDLLPLSGSGVQPPASEPGIAIALNGSGLGVLIGPTGGRNVLDVLDVSDPRNTFVPVNRFALPGAPAGVALASGIAFVADESAGLQVVNFLPFESKGQPPTVSISTTYTGSAIAEGATLPIKVTAQDDVQVRNVELLVNGQVVANDVSLPYDFQPIAPTLASGATNMTVQVQATDTGGNSTLSNVLTFPLVKDTVPPTILSTTPADGSLQDTSLRTILVRFSKPVDPVLFSSAFHLLDSGGNPINLTYIGGRAGNRIAELQVGPLATGSYQLVIHGTSIKDLAGNVLSQGDVVKSFIVSRNFIVNGDAESGSGSTNGSVVGTVPGWALYNNFTVVKYGAVGPTGEVFPTPVDPGPSNRGTNFFAGGPSLVSDASQSIVLATTDAPAIDQGTATFSLSAYLGGFGTDGARPDIQLTFNNASGQSIGLGVVLGGASASDRGNLTGLLAGSNSGLIPAGTRSIVVLLDMVGIANAYNYDNAFADNLELLLSVG
jgi:hypothetical protein